MRTRHYIALGLAGALLGGLATLPGHHAKKPAALSTATHVVVTPHLTPSPSPSPKKVVVKPRPKATPVPAKRPLPVVTPGDTPAPVVSPSATPEVSPTPTPSPSVSPEPYKPAENDICPKDTSAGVLCWHVTVAPSTDQPGMYEYSCFYAFTDNTWVELPIKMSDKPDEALNCQS
jgi:hypothetical protein